MVITLKKSIIFIIIIGLIVTLLSFFIDIKKEEDKPNNKGIVYSVDNISKNLKKITELNKRDEDIICATSIALLEKDKDGNIIPALAENTEVSEDGIEYKFHIRNDKYKAFHSMNNNHLEEVDFLLLAYLHLLLDQQLQHQNQV